MFMFRKTERIVSTSADLQKEAKKFQEAVSEINTLYKPQQLDISLIEGVAKKFDVDPSIIASAFETFLKNNAVSAVNRVKASNDYTIYNLEQAAESYGYDLESLGLS